MQTVWEFKGGPLDGMKLDAWDLEKPVTPPFPLNRGVDYALRERRGLPDDYVFVAPELTAS